MSVGRSSPRRSRGTLNASPKQLAAIALVASLIALSALLALRFEHWRTRVQQRRVIAVQAAELDRELARLTIVPRLLADDPRVIDALSSGDPLSGHPSPAHAARDPADAARTANRLLERARSRSGAAVLYLMDRDGLTVAASNWADPTSFVGIDYGFRPYFRGALAGRETTFFGVGATTGEPGYFIAHPVAEGGRVIGVLVAKVALDAPLDAWRERAHRSLVTDELGVVILSSDPALLYASSTPLDEAARERLASDRRYRPNENGTLVLSSTRARLGGARQLLSSRALEREPWTLHLLVPERRLLGRATLSGAAVLALLAVAVLLFERSRRQRRLAETEQRAARELERLVASRTEALEKAQRALIAESNFAMLGRMSAAVNHEINQPLASLRLDLATLRRLAERDPPPLEEMRRTIVDGDRTTRRIGRVVATLRSLARRGAGDFMPLDAAGLVDEVVATLRRERPRDVAALRLPLCEKGAIVFGNAVLLQQALLNLLHNAFEAVSREAEPAVTIGLLRSPPGGVTLSVADNGPGVPPSLSERLFEPFATASVSGEGLGLGLALARQIVEDHGGTLAYRAGEDGGSVFEMRLPAEASRAGVDAEGSGDGR